MLRQIHLYILVAVEEKILKNRKMEKFKLIRQDEKLGVWIKEEELIKIIKVLKSRHSSLHNKLLSDYEYLTEQKADFSNIKRL